MSIINSSGVTKVATIAVGDTDVSAPVSHFHLTGSGRWVNAGGSNILLEWLDDPANHQGANNAFDAAGTMLGTFTSSGTDPLHSFSTDQTGAVSDSAPFSMTIWAQATLTSEAVLLNRGQGEVKTANPEPSTWAMIALGFAGLGYAGFRQTRQASRSLA